MGRERMLAGSELDLELCGIVSEGGGDGEGNEENAIGVVEVEQLGWYAYRGGTVTDVRLR